MSELGNALRRKFKRPGDVLRALGLDERLIDIERGHRRGRPRLALDAVGRSAVQASLHEHLQGPVLEKALELCSGELDDAELYVALESLIVENLGSSERMLALEMLENIKPAHGDSAFDDDEDRELIDRMLDRAETLLRSRDVSDDDEFRRRYRQFRADDRRRASDAETPRNGLSQDRRRRIAGDTAREAFDRRWPEAGRIGGGDYGERAFAMDDAEMDWESLYERFPDAARIGNAGGV